MGRDPLVADNRNAELGKYGITKAMIVVSMGIDRAHDWFAEALPQLIDYCPGFTG